MHVFRHVGSLTIIGLLAVLLAACGGAATPNTPATTANTNNTTNTTPAATSTPVANATPTATGNMDAGNMMQGLTIIPDTGGDMAAFISTGKVTINGQPISVLLTHTGSAIYYYKADTMLQATCTAACAKDWPPVLAPQGMMTVASSMMLPKQLSVHQTANGAQVFYDGHALYTYAQDKQAGTATGRGQDMQWYLVGFLL